MPIIASRAGGSASSFGGLRTFAPPIKSNGLIVADAFAVAVARLAVAELADA